MIEQFFRDPKTIQRMNEGPLGPYLNTFAKHIHDQGFARKNGCYQIRVLAGFNRWIKINNFEVKDINHHKIDDFIDYRKKFIKINHPDKPALNRLLDILNDIGIIVDSEQNEVKTDCQLIEDDYEQFLSHERQLAPSTILNYMPVVHKFLSECFSTNKIQFCKLQAKDITGFIRCQAQAVSAKRAKIIVTAIRSFLKYLLLQGKINTDLSSCVPTVPCWKLSTLPKFLQPAQVQAVLRGCDRKTSLGMRNYAILLLLARLGLRACEIIFLTLDDIEWEDGYISIHGKGGSISRLPLPKDAGEAIAAYLKYGRPTCSTRRVFVRHKAPIRELGNSSTISSIVRRALKHAGIKSSYMGAHIFRHTVATEMLNQGASLYEIGELLGHSNPNTTSIYAKVDIKALKKLAQPWPGGVQ
jgi:site-specific recombinase XerD